MTKQNQVASCIKNRTAEVTSRRSGNAGIVAEWCQHLFERTAQPTQTQYMKPRSITVLSGGFEIVKLGVG